MLKIVVGEGSCGIAAGAAKVYNRLESLINDGVLKDCELSVTGCIGMCYLEPIVDVYADDGLHRYVKVNGEIAEKIATAINNNDLLSA
jgi:NADH-quinone oxidoreductase subunit F